MESPASPGGRDVAASCPGPTANADALRHVRVLNVPRAKRGHTTVAVEVRILAPFEEFNVHWVDGRSKSRPCWGHDECPHCQADGHDVRRCAYAAAEVYEYDALGRRSASLIALYVPEKQIPIAKSIPIGSVVKLTRIGSGMGEKLRFELVTTPGNQADRGRVHEPFDARAYMVRFWFKGPVPKSFNHAAPDGPIAALPGLPLTPPLPFVEAEESAADFLMSHFKTNTLAGAAAALREQLAATAPPPAPPPPSADDREQWRNDEVTWHDGPAAAARNRMEVTQACHRARLTPFAPTYPDECSRSRTDYLAAAKLLEAAGEAKAGLLLRETASRRFDGCPGKPPAPNPADPVPHAGPRPAEPAAPGSGVTRPVTSALPAGGRTRGTGSARGVNVARLAMGIAATTFFAETP